MEQEQIEIASINNQVSFLLVGIDSILHLLNRYGTQTC